MPMRGFYSDFNDAPAPEFDKQYQYYDLQGGNDDELLTGAEFDWQQEYPATFFYAFCKKSIHKLTFIEGSLTSIAKLGFGVGLVAAESLKQKDGAFWFLGREGNFIAVYRWHPYQGKPVQISPPIQDQFDRFDRRFLNKAIAWVDACIKGIRFEFPEFGS